MSDTQLQIVLSLIDNASAQLQEAQDAFAKLGTSASEAAAQITSSLTSAEEEVAAQAQAVADSWESAGGDIATTFEEVVPTVESALESLAGVNLSAAQQVAAQWRAEGQAMSDSLNAAMAEVDATMVEDATVAGEKAGAAAGEGFGEYFKKMIIGYAFQQIGSFLSGGIDSAIAAVSKNSNQVSTLTAQIQQQKAAIAQNEAALQKWNGTTAEVNAAHQRAVANIDAEKVKITELTQQLAPLTQAQGGLTGSTEGVANSLLLWIGAHKQLDTAIQTFLTTLGPLLEGLAAVLIAITLIQVALDTLTGLFAVLMGWALGIAVAIAALAVIWVLFHKQIIDFFTDLNAKTGILDLFKEAWQSISDNFTDNLLPALDRLWNAMQPLKPYLEALAVVVGATLLGAIVLLTDALTIAINIFTDILTAATKVATFFTDVLVVALNAVERAIEAIITAVSKVASVGGAIGGVISSTISNVLHVHDAIITPSGGVIQTDPADYLIATKTPGALAGAGGGNIQIFIQGGTYLDQNGATTIANALARQIGMQIKLRNFV